MVRSYSFRVVLVILGLNVAGCGTTPGTPITDGGNGNSEMSVAITDGGSDMAIGCGLRTCQKANVNCGPIGDGCGGLISCGSCVPPETCGGGGVPSVCGGKGGCVPKTCMGLGVNCGPVADECGGLLMCGTCMSGSCGGGGKPSVCGGGSPGDGGAVDGGGMICTPKTCLALGFSCGPAGDGCGGLLQCGTCPMGQACGVNKPSVCGPANGGCVPKTCMGLNYNCGMAGDGCGGIINCGMNCVAPDICGGGGVPNRCGGGSVDGGVVSKCDSGITTVSGTVFAPTDASLGYGNPDPLYGALVYIAGGQVMPFTAGVSCDKCGAGVTGNPIVSVVTGPDGKFVLSNAPCGMNVKLVIQLGRWRRQVTLANVACCVDNPLTPDQTRLPRNKTEGDIPLIAVSTGSADPIECVLPKIGIDQSEYSLPNGAGRVRIYTDNGADIGGGTPPASALYGDPAELAKYDMVIFDCVGTQVNKTMMEQQNVINYADSGGRVYASHFSYVWLYNDVPFSTTAMWQVGQANPPDLTALIDMTFPKGVAFAQWALLVGASPMLGQLPVQQVRHDFNAVVPPAQRWVYADPNQQPNTPLHYTFNTPVGALPANQCGRVMFSDFHVNTGGLGFGPFPAECGAPSPMTPQEKVLEFMLFDLGSCIQPDVPTCTPLTCLQQKANCGPVGDGCGNIIQCGPCPMGQVCGGGGPNICGPACAPRTCLVQGIDCGPAGDGCGNLIQCGMCPMGQICGGGGPGKCGAADLAMGCVLQTCKQQGLMCGPAGDGCGGQIDCGPCPMGQTCGGGGTPGVCGSLPCVKRTCVQVGADCGLIGDGCGGIVNCGTCPLGKTCGGGGIPNVCGSIG